MTDSMVLNDKLIRFCQIIHPYNIPCIKFKELDVRYKLIYKKEYKIDENDINKASFLIFLISFIVLFITSIIITNFSLIIIIIYSFLLALIFSYTFNIRFYKDIKQKEKQINALLYLVKIYFSLIQKSLGENADYSINFIKLIKEYKLPISKDFGEILSKIQLGQNPEALLSELITPSEDFNSYLKSLLLSNFSHNNIRNGFSENSLEKQFRTYLREIESKLTVLFFIGLFFPLGLCFLILFQRINYFLLISILPLFFLSLKFLTKKFLKNDFFLLGLINNYSKKEKTQFDEFISFLISFTMNLKRNISPEIAFIKSYSQNKRQFNLLEKPLKTQISKLLNFSCSFDEILENLHFELKSIRFKLILDVIGKIVAENAYLSHEKITDIINVISNHQKLENRLEVIIRGERFKVLLFLLLLPIIIGGIGGLVPLFNFVISNVTFNFGFNLTSLFDLIFTYDVIILFFSLFFCVYISSYYFLRIINYERRGILLVVSNTLYILAFFFSCINILNYI